MAGEQPEQDEATEHGVGGVKHRDANVDALCLEVGVASLGEETRPDAEGAVFACGETELRDSAEQLEQQAADLAVELGDGALALEGVRRGHDGDDSGDDDQPRRSERQRRIDHE